MSAMEMDYETAGKIFAELAIRGRDKLMDSYLDSQDVQDILENMAAEVGCTVIRDKEYCYLVPVSVKSPYTMTMSNVKDTWFRTSGGDTTNVYIAYLLALLLLVHFDDQYDGQGNDDFVRWERWQSDADALFKRMRTGVETGQPLDTEWEKVLDYWESMDVQNPTAGKDTKKSRTQKGHFLTAQKILQDTNIIRVEGDEISLTVFGQRLLRYYQQHGEEQKENIYSFLHEYAQEERG